MSQKQIILGGLLGDLYFNKEKNVLSFSHCERQLEYLTWKSKFFQDYNPNIRRTIQRWNNNEYVGYCFNIGSYIKNNKDLFKFIKTHLYANSGRKKISLKYLNELSPIALAVWWMDDGCLSIYKGNRYGKLCTHYFNYEEHILIQKYFVKKFNIKPQIVQEKGKYYFLRFNATELKKFIKIIYKYVCEIPSMIYKIDLCYKNQKCIGDFLEIYTYIKNHQI